MLYEIEVLQSDCERIGDPIALPLTDIINSGTSANRLGKIIKMKRKSNIIVENTLDATTNNQAQPSVPAAGIMKKFYYMKLMKSAFSVD